MATITEDFVSSETAKLLKEKGFPQEPNVCNTIYKPKGEFSNNAKSFWNPFAFTILGREYCMAPTLQMARKWLREEYNIFIQVCVIPHYTITVEQEYYFIKLYINRRWKSFQELDEMRFSSPELAYEAAIKYCLEHLI